MSNQAGVNRGALDASQLESVHERLRADVAAAGGRIDAIYVCPHDWDEGCECRKPRPGMLFQAQRDHDLDLTRTFFLGDDERDGQAAAAARMPVRSRHGGDAARWTSYAILIAGRLEETLAR